MGTIPSGGSGCLCSSISLVKVLVESFRNRPWEYDYIIVDSQAGPEILGRGLATRFDCNLVVTEAMPKAMEVTRQVFKLSEDLDIRRTVLVLNKVEHEEDVQRVKTELRSMLSRMSGKLQELTGLKVIVGPRESSGIPKVLRSL